MGLKSQAGGNAEMMKSRILIVPIGSGMAMSALKDLSKADDLEIIVADSDPVTPGMNMGFPSFVVPSIEDEEFFPVLEEIIVREKIDLVIPCLDTFLIPFARRRADIERLGAKVMTSPTEALELSRDKWEMYTRLEGKVPQPKSSIDPSIIDELRYPIFIKPRDGSGSINAFKVENREEAEFYLSRISNPIIQEYLPGREYTVDCIADMNGRLLSASPRLRIRTKSGICTISKTVSNALLEEAAGKITEEIPVNGPFFFQAKEDESGLPKLTEINIRLAGTMALTTRAGVNIPLTAVRIFLGQKTPPIGRTKKGLYLARYWEEIYFSETQLESISSTALENAHA
ncbi:MAG: hypothetical protein B6D63_04715 [Candidatus Latescibacteria bacterium 4484_7]|nr:MAG: hypothetical protein B6D63_04715 [Candidatus Latescibacteria bacterium 4484_7]RKZ09215.1 MAG: hypothetical protein DRQ05_00015 [bacterium]